MNYKEFYIEAIELLESYTEPEKAFNEAKVYELVEKGREVEIEEKIHFFLENQPYYDELKENVELDDLDFLLKYTYSDSWKELFKKYLPDIDLLKKRIKVIIDRREKENE